MNKKHSLMDDLVSLGLNNREADIYLTLLKQPVTHAHLSDLTGVNRTTLYRIIRGLEKRGLVTVRVDDTGRFLTAANPAVIESDILAQENRAHEQRKAFERALPHLQSLQQGPAADFAIHTYEGIDGFKRMLWHELKTKGTCCCIGGAALESLGIEHGWADRHRAKTVEAGYIILEIANPGVTPQIFTDVGEFINSHYELRIAPKEVLPINHLLTVYNDTVATYNVYEGRAMGIEIISKTYSIMMRHIFMSLWNQAASTHVTTIPEVD